MLHLIDDIRADYSFTGDSLSRPIDTVIYINDREHYDPLRHTRPTMEFQDLDEVFQSFGDMPTLMETLLSISGDCYLMLDEVDLNRLLVAHVKSIYPNISFEMTYLIVKTSYIHHRYVQVKGTEYDEYLKTLRVPTRDELRSYYDESTVGSGYSDKLKYHLGYEFLLAHTLAVDFDPNDSFVQFFTQKVTDLLWKSASRDYMKRRMALLFNAYQIRQNFHLPLDLEREDIDRQFNGGVLQKFFDINVDYKDVDYLKENYGRIAPMMSRIDHLSEIGESSERQMKQLLRPYVPLTVAQLQTIIEVDKQGTWTFLFGREKMTKDTNAVFISYLYNASPEELQELRLTS